MCQNHWMPHLVSPPVEPNPLEAYGCQSSIVSDNHRQVLSRETDGASVWRRNLRLGSLVSYQLIVGIF